MSSLEDTSFVPSGEDNVPLPPSEGGGWLRHLQVTGRGVRILYQRSADASF